MSKFETRQLEAGGFISAKSKADAQGTEELVARRYAGQALGNRVVVQLTAQRLGPAVDLAMEYLGLEAAGESKPLARQNRQALGFANWALTNHPKHAKYALGLLKRVKAAARRAKSKPGHAWDDFNQMANELDKSVRHFLPAFWEEAARIYKDNGNQTYAGRSLNKALEAERVHAIEVDREHRRDAVLEFTLSGCLSGKALSDYAKDLQAQFDPPDAYATLRDLVVRRTLGGMAPTATTGTDLIRLAKAAGLDSNAELESVLEEIIGSPAMPRAPLQFWKSVKAPVKRIVKRSPEFAVWLLVHTTPQSRYSGDSVIWQWLDLLDGWGVLPYLWADKLPSEPEIPGGRAGWIGRLARVETSPDKRIFELLEQMAAVLQQEGQPVSLFEKQRWGYAKIDVDVLEACLDLGIELCELPDEFQVDFDGWLRAEADHPRRNSLLMHSCADPRIASKIREKMPELIQFHGETTNQHTYGRQLASRRSFEEAAENHPAIHDAWWAYLDEQLQRLETGGMPDAEFALANLRKSVGRRTASQFPELPERLESISLANSLQRTLTAGVLDEYGWPALEEATQAVKLPPPSRYHDNNLTWAFPLLCYYRDGSLVTVRPDGVETRQLTILKTQNLTALLPVQDDIFVSFRDSSYKTFVRWLSDPKKDIELKESLYYFRPDAIVSVDDGVFVGQRLLKPGDKSIPEPSRFFHDGERFWQPKSRVHQRYWVDDDNDESGLAEIDPRSGKHQRDSVPSWFEEDLPSGARINWNFSQLLPCPAGDSESPLGSRGGLLGWKVVRRRDGSWEGYGIDGRRVTFRDEDRSYYQRLLPLAMMDQPSGESRWIFTHGGLVIDEGTRICMADFRENRTSYCEGQPCQISTAFLHLMRVRHEPSSKRLRELGAEETQTILEAAAKHHEALRRQARDPQGDKDDSKRRLAIVAVEKLLPEAPENLIKGVARIARLAAEEQLALDKLRAKLADQASGTSDAGSGGVEGARITAGLSQLAIPTPKGVYHMRSREKCDCELHLREVTQFLKGERDAEVAECDVPWLNLFLNLPWVAWKTFWTLATAEDQHSSISRRVRQPWLDTLDFVAQTGLLELPGSFRLHTGAPGKDKKKVGSLRCVATSCEIQGKNRYIVQQLDGYPGDVAHVLEYAPTGKFKTPKGFTIDETMIADVGWNVRQLKAFVKAARQVEELPFVSSETLEQAAENLGVTPAEAAIAWMGNLRTVTYGNDKLTKEIRSHYGWKVKPVQEAIAALDATPLSDSVIAAAVAQDPAGALGDRREAAFARLVQAWKETQSDVLRFPPELISLFEKSGHRYSSSGSEELIRLYRERGAADLLTARKFQFQRDESARSYSGIAQNYPLEGHTRLLNSAVFSIRLFNYATPSGDPVRRVLPELIQAIRTWLANDWTVLPFGMSLATRDMEKFDASDIIAKYEQVLKKFKKGKDGLDQCDDGLVIAALLPPHVQTVFRPARLTNEKALEHLVAVAALSNNWETTGEKAIDHAHLVLEIRGQNMSRIAEVNQDNPIEEGCWEQDPRRSAAKTVAGVQKKLKLDEDSAALYLQLLALHDPTTANLRKWNDWSAKQIKEAAAPLCENELVVQAKRSRAGRDVFLPGGWEALKAPNLPIETWKLPLFELSEEQLDKIRYRQIVPLAPVADLFAAAWKRIEAGDIPKYDEK